MFWCLCHYSCTSKQILYCNMRVVSLVSGGKDSCFNMMHVVVEGHEIVALANLHPLAPDTDELDSYMYQTVGHEAINLYSQAMELPLFRRKIHGSSHTVEMDYIPHDKDEVEDLYELLKEIKKTIDFDAVASGAILSDYQRIRVESVCSRLGLKSLSYLWRRNQEELLQEMIDSKLEAILIKTAALGLHPKKHLGKTLQDMKPTLHDLSQKYGCHVCGEGGEFETFTLDCPLFKKRIIIDESEIIVHSDDHFAPVAYLKLKSLHLKEKNPDEIPCLKSLSLMTSEKWEMNFLSTIKELSLNTEVIPAVSEPKITWTFSTDKDLTSCEVRARSGGKYLTISNLCGRTYRTPSVESIKSVTMEVLHSLEDTLLKHDHKLQDVCYIQLNVADMSHYKIINEVYSQYFGQNPPARACIGCLPRLKRMHSKQPVLQLYCVSCHNVEIKKSMHVQGLSHWAPANIGPFSQCVRVDNFLFISGTIALIPGNLELISGGVLSQASLALHHVNSVVTAMVPSTSTRHFLQCICYVTKREHILHAQRAWENKHINVPQNELCHVIYLVVNELPRNALAEWQGVVCPTTEASTQSCDCGRTDGQTLALQWSMMKMIRNDHVLYCCTFSIETPRENTTLDVVACLKELSANMGRILKQQDLSIDDILQATIHYTGDGTDPDSLQGAWDQLHTCLSLPKSITFVRVYDIYTMGFYSCLSCTCIIGPVKKLE